jgi:hypothetical protein
MPPLTEPPNAERQMVDTRGRQLGDSMDKPTKEQLDAADAEARRTVAIVLVADKKLEDALETLESAALAYARAKHDYLIADEINGRAYACLKHMEALAKRDEVRHDTDATG